MSADALDWPVRKLAAAIATGELRAEEVAAASIARIEATNGELGAFISVQAEGAVARAKGVDSKRARGEQLGALAGVPIGVKDALVTKDAPTTAGSRILCKGPLGSSGEAKADASRGYRSPFNATVVQKLLDADAVIVGKCNMDEFAMGSSNEHSTFGPAKNPFDVTRTPGGSSGGSAVSVASGMTPLAIGSDTGGSIRQPAAFTGLVGFKPTYGRVSRYGLIAFASSLDQVGGFARDVDSAELLASVIQGHDPRDATSLRLPFAAASEALSLRGARIGVPSDADGEGTSDEVRSSFNQALSALEKAGAVVERVAMPHARYGISAYYVISAAEASSNLARYDGVRYGLRESRESLQGMYRATRSAGFGDEVKRRILLGTYVLSAGYYDAYYVRAQKVRTLIRRDFEQAFAKFDVLMTPTAPTVAFKLGSKTDDPLAMYAADVFTLPASLAGLPAMSIPSTRRPLPIGLQIIAPPLAEAKLFAMARAAEEALAGS